MATDSWIVDADGNCANPLNWSNQAVPQSSDDVVIATADPHTITFNSGNASINSLTLGDDVLLVASGTITAGSGTALDAASTVNLSGGSLDLTGSATFSSDSVVGLNQLQTDGATSVSGLTIGGTVVWANAGAVTQSGASVTIGDNLGNVAELDIQSGATYDITDDTGINSGSSTGSYIVNAGTFDKSDPTGLSVIKVDFRDTGTVECAGGNLRIDGPQNSLAGTYIGPGMIDYGPDGVSTLGALAFTQGACGTNFGVVNVAGIVTIADGSTLKNLATATWNFVGDVGLALAAGSSNPLFTNMGAMAKTSGSGTSVVAIDMTDEGTVTVASGTLAFDGASNSVSGLIKGAGTIDFGGNTAINSGVNLVVAKVAISGPATTVTVNTNVGYAGSFSEGAGDTLNLSGGFFVSKGASTLSGAMTGSHWLYTEAASTISGMTIGGTVGLYNTSSLTQSGADVTLGDQLGNIAVLNNVSTATYDITDDTGIDIGAASGSYIFNAGLFEKTGGSANSQIMPRIANSGTIEVTAATLELHGAVSGIGADKILGASTLQLDSTVSSGQTVSFAGGGGELILGDPQAFAAKIAGFDTVGAGMNDTIDIVGPYTYAGFTQTSATQGTLNLVDGNLHSSITLLGNFTAGTFVNHGGLLTYT
jgi:hypothetical protein